MAKHNKKAFQQLWSYLNKLPESTRQSYLRWLYKNEFINKTRIINRKLIEVIVDGKPIEKSLIRAMSDNMASALYTVEKAMALETARSVLGSGIIDEDIATLNTLLKERERVLFRSAQNYSFIIDNEQKRILKDYGVWRDFLDEITIGRRGQDIIRQQALESLQRGLIEGQPTIKIRDELGDLLKRLPTLDPQKPGQFPLEVYPYNGRFRWYNINQYAELVSNATVNEARQQSHIEEAKRSETRFIQYNYTGKPYRRLDDPCWKIDGKVFSIVKEVQQGGAWGAIGRSGKFYPYVYDSTAGIYQPDYNNKSKSYTPIKSYRKKFALLHPHCTHIARGKPESVA